MNDPIVVTRELVKRGWSDIEPKLVTALASGSATAFLLTVAKAYGITVPETVVSAMPLFAALLIGYLTPSVGTTVTKKIDGNGSTSEAHSGAVITTVTASTPIQYSAPAPTVTPEQKTEVFPSRAENILSQLPHSEPVPVSGDAPPWMQQ